MSDDKLRYFLNRVTANLHETRQRLQEIESAAAEPVAIVGMGCRFPGGVRSPEDLWDLMAAGADALSGFPADRGWDLDGLYDPDPDHPGTSYTRAGGFMHDADAFDAGFFGISPREAIAMDPQQRLLLEVSWEAVERAGIPPASLRGQPVGVFIGAAPTGYGYDMGLPGELEGYLSTGTAGSVTSGRVSYVLGLEGPAVTVDTACSSALVALHLAVRALRAGDCSMALAGGVTLMTTPAVFVWSSRQRGLSPDGRCKAFSADADGMGMAEGAGVVLLERLSDARRNGHRVLAVVAGSAINQDGASNGLTAPNGPSQQRVIRAALASAGLSPQDVDVVEAHGSGTALGDPIEAQAVIATYGQDRPEDRPLWLGSVKSNIGHPQQAAGAAGLIKLVLALQHEVLPPTLHADEPSPHVDWSAGEVRLATEAVPWPANGQPRRAGLSSFGMSGTNVHVIVAEAPAQEDAEEDAAEDTGDAGQDGAGGDGARAPLVSGVVPWALSARSAGALAAQAGRLAAHDQSRPGLEPADVAWSLATTRSVFEHRAVVLGADRADLADGLAALAGSQPVPSVMTGTASDPGKLVFIFPGQGAHWAGMGRELAAVCPVFAARLGECAAALAPYVDWDLLAVIDGEPGAPGLDAAEVAQPALWAVMVSLAAVWQAAGVAPDAVVGHSQGEIAAATVAGILSLDDAARVVAVRSRTLSGLGDAGGMVSVVMPEDRVRELLARWEGRLSVAAVNGPAATVVSGELEALAEFEAELAARHVMRWPVPASDFVAHSAAVESLASVLANDLSGIVPSAGRVPLFSTVEPGWADGTAMDVGYWYANVRQTVRFADAVAILSGAGYGAFVEVSPHPTLEASVGDTIEAAGTTTMPVISGTLHRESAGAVQLLSVMARAWTRGVPVDWGTVLGSGQRVDLPTYAFQHQRYWAKPDRQKLYQAGTDAWWYRVSWAPVPDPASAARLTGTWLVVAPAGRGGETATWCASLLASHGARAETLQVPAGTGREDLAALIAPVDGGADGGLSGVVSLLALEDAPLTGEPSVPEGLARTLALLQALGDTGTAAPLWVVTSGAVATGPGDVLSRPAQAQVWGLGRSAALEHADRWGGLIDLPPAPGEPGAVPGVPMLDERTAARLAVVLAGGCGPEDQLAIRIAGLFGRRLLRATAPGRAREPWVPGGTVLVTGGTGALGGHAARLLAARGTPRLVLAGRSGPAAPGAAGLAAGLARAGSAVEVVACDIADRDQVSGLVARIGGSGPGLAAVMHAAGVLDDGLLDRLCPDRLASVLAAKADGAWSLHELTAGLDLERFVLFSSAAAVFGGAGQGNYAAANAFLDALAEHRAAAGLPALSVAWGPWAGGGVAGASEAVRQRLRRGPLTGMDPAVATTALGRALDQADPALAVMDVDWAQFAIAPTALVADLPDVARLAPAAVPRSGGTAGEDLPGGELARRLSGLPAAEQARQLTELVRAGAAAVLGHASPEAIDPQRAFSDLGFDSLTTLEMRQHVAAATRLRLPSTLLFDYPTPAALAEFLRSELLGAAEPETAAPAVSAPPAAGAAGDPVAVVGMACRFPGGVRSPEELWQLLAAGGDAISGFPADRGWDLAALYDPDPGRDGTSYVRGGGFVYDASEFDAGFFGISPREALAMDPQQRLLLETCWEALERSGANPATLRGSRTGVFAGAAFSGYSTALQIALQGTGGLEGHLMTGNATSVLSGRVAYALGLEGPAVTIDTACSSALVALHLAAQALRAGECDLALAGGVTVLATPGDLVSFSRQRGLAADGRSKPFSADADGMGMAEGVGVLVVERLSDARRNGHLVLAVIAGSAVNQDGASNGLTAPNGLAQQRVIRAALASAGLSPQDVDAVEAHGTGTELGDPIEAGALIAAYGQDRVGGQPLWLGSVKSNLGHTQAAAGAAGAIKMIMALRHEVLPPTLHADEPSPHVDWDAGDVRLLTEPVDWPVTGRPRRAGVSSFGISGTNAHLILAEAPAPDPDTGPGEGTGEHVPGERHAGQAADRQVEGGRVIAGRDVASPVVSGGPAVWLVSGRSAAALRAQAARLADWAREGWAREQPELNLADVAWSLTTTRSVFEHRAVVLGTGQEDLVARLNAVASDQTPAGVVTGAVPAGGPGRVGFLFSGQGSQRAGMGAELHAASPVFAAAFDQACALLEAELGVPVAEVVLGEGEDERADQTLYAQPGLFAVQAGLVALLAACGITPDAVAGHSVGEIGAAYAAGVLSLEDACRLVAVRARLMQELPEGGAMIAIEAGESEITAALETAALEGVSGVSLAAVNGPSSVVISGDADAVAGVAGMLREQGRRVRALRVSHAFHSARMDPILAGLSETAAALKHQTPRIPWARALTGRLDVGCDQDYWVSQAREPVRFADTVTAMAAEGVSVFIEIGPDGTLSGLGPAALALDSDADDGDSADSADGTVFIPALRSRQSAQAALLTALGRAHVRGVAVDWPAVFGAHERVDLPTYAFQRQRYWPQGTQAALATLAAQGWRYQASWAPVSEPGRAMLAGTWLLVVPAGQAGSRLAGECTQALTTHGARPVLVTVTVGELDREALAARIGQAAQAAEPADARAGAASGSGASGNGAARQKGAGAVQVAGVSGVLSLLALEEAPVPGFPHLTAGVARTLALVQALGDAGVGAPLWVLTRGAVAIGADEVLASPVPGQVWGLGRVAALEHPDRWGGLIDLPPVLGEQSALDERPVRHERPVLDERMGTRLCGVLAGRTEDQVAIRSAGIFARRLVRTPPPRGGRPWVPGGTVLMTGGTGAIGGQVARWLADRGAPRVVLASRSGPTGREVAARAERLAAAGSAVEVIACDIADRAQAAGLLARILATGAPLTGVLHAAGLGQDTALDQLSLTEFDTLLAAKAAGAAHLDALTQDLDLEQFVLFSSIAATWGSGLQAAYAAANAFLDGLAQTRRGRGQAATSVAWGPWAGGGMTDSENAVQLQRRGLEPMDPRQAIGALEQVLDSREDLVTVADVNWSRFAPPFTLRRPSPLIEALPEVRHALSEPVPEDGPRPAGTTLGQRLAGLPAAEQDRFLVNLIQAEAAAVLGYPSQDQVEAGRAFRDLGFDSLTAVELRDRLNGATGLRLPATLIFDYPTPHVLAGYLWAEEFQHQVAPTPPLLEELDKLESLLSEAPADDATRQLVTSRLERALAKWNTGNRPESQSVAEKMSSASDDEIFTFINKELGRS